MKSKVHWAVELRTGPYTTLLRDFDNQFDRKSDAIDAARRLVREGKCGRAYVFRVEERIIFCSSSEPEV